MIKNQYVTSSFSRHMRKKEFVNRLIEGVKTRLKKETLTSEEKRQMRTILESFNDQMFAGKTEDVIAKTIIDFVSRELSTLACPREDVVDIHEILKGQIDIASADYKANFSDQIVSSFVNQVDVISVFGAKTLTDIQKIFTPTLAKKCTKIVLDTKNRLLDNDGTQTFKWNFINNETTAQGTVNAKGNIRAISSMRISPLRIPYIAAADNDFKRITMQIDEFTAQGAISRAYVYHFMFKSVIEGRWINLETIDFNDGRFEFSSPIVRVDTLTIKFAAPFDTIVFDPDRLIANVTGYGVETQFTTTIEHGLETGDLVVISNFLTKNISTDASVISQINKTSGYRIINVSSTVFTISVNSSSVRVQGTGLVTATNGSAIIAGAGTAFLTFFNTGDNIEINGIQYEIQNVSSDTSLALVNTFSATTLVGVVYYRNNIAPIGVNVYLEAKRIIMEIALEYFEA